MPQSDELPDAIKNLARRQGIEISHNHFESDVERLIDALCASGRNTGDRSRKWSLRAGRPYSPSRSEVSRFGFSPP
jgi:hypothetical protein